MRSISDLLQFTPALFWLFQSDDRAISAGAALRAAQAEVSTLSYRRSALDPAGAQGPILSSLTVGVNCCVKGNALFEVKDDLPPDLQRRSVIARLTSVYSLARFPQNTTNRKAAWKKADVDHFKFFASCTFHQFWNVAAHQQSSARPTHDHIRKVPYYSKQNIYPKHMRASRTGDL